MTDFLDIDSGRPATDFLDIDSGRAEMAKAALEVASLYTVFVTDERAKQLLALWDQQLLNRRVPEGATLDQYARAEALRSFVAGIHEQIRLASTRGG